MAAHDKDGGNASKALWQWLDPSYSGLKKNNGTIHWPSCCLEMFYGTRSLRGLAFRELNVRHLWPAHPYLSTWLTLWLTAKEKADKVQKRGGILWEWVKT